MTREAIIRSRREERIEARKVAIYVCQRLAGMNLGPMARLFGVGGYSAVSSVIARTRHRLKAGGTVARRLVEVRRRLET